MSGHDWRIGATVDRMVAGMVLMQLTITAIEDDLVVCGAWTFDRTTGAEVDDELGWGPAYAYTGSYIRACNDLQIGTS